MQAIIDFSQGKMRADMINACHEAVTCRVPGATLISGTLIRAATKVGTAAIVEALAQGNQLPSGALTVWPLRASLKVYSYRASTRTDTITFCSPLEMAARKVYGSQRLIDALCGGLEIDRAALILNVYSVAEEAWSMNDEEPELSDAMNSTSLVLPDQALPDVIHLVPVRGRPFFPAQVQPVIVDADPWQGTLQSVADSGGQPLAGLVYVDDDSELENPGDYPEIACVARLISAESSGGKIQFVAQGLARARIKQWLNKEPPYRVRVEYPEPPHEQEEQVKAYAMAIIGAIKELLPLNPLYSEELRHYLNRFSPNEPSPLADFAASLTTAPGPELQDVLETIPLLRRMEKVLVLLRKELEVWVRAEIGPIAKPDLIQWAPGLPKTRSGKIMRRILRKIAENDFGALGDTSTLADPSVVDDLIENRMNKA